MEFQTISVVGLGYIGLPTATVFASRQRRVIGVDVNQHAVDTINQGKIHIVEPDLDMLVQAAVNQGYLRATTTPEPADVFMIAVPTPFAENKRPDLAYIEAAAKSIAPALQPGNLVILESTSPVGTTEKLSQWLSQTRPDLTFPRDGDEKSDVYVAYCPERVLPGRVLTELVENDRVIGGLNKRSSELARDLYKLFVRGELIITSARTAEMCKLSENSFRDVNIAFANELSLVCDHLGINVWELIKLANRHPRVNILKPGPGVGGHCIAVDPWFIVDSAPDQTPLIQCARAVNDGKPHKVTEQVARAAARFKNPVIACLGLSFKADIDDIRESPAVEIVSNLANSNAGQIIVVEPFIRELPKSLTGKAELCGLSQALREADVMVLLVDHTDFSQISPTLLQQKVVIDTRGTWSS